MGGHGSAQMDGPEDDGTNGGDEGRVTREERTAREHPAGAGDPK